MLTRLADNNNAIFIIEKSNKIKITTGFIESDAGLKLVIVIILHIIKHKCKLIRISLRLIFLLNVILCHYNLIFNFFMP